ncbi:hypothetical protein RIR_jg5482.t1 [Rhizophagus irregularis DAOM 181602=DAOM 197198]|uniref:Uncharacterized protein n=1 Tax=Rhizophagus irregularis (strain DAOM 181602 / DAOM 197198 / MUCL 43194) TaxID=747089 RepID=U9U6R0_RHIID|nr:hypothetical protein RIR_jg5482.t1 [Rhizophagus irregularis DAOM 181602=DAOM 197198]
MEWISYESLHQNLSWRIKVRPLKCKEESRRSHIFKLTHQSMLLHSKSFTMKKSQEIICVWFTTFMDPVIIYS